MKILHLSDFHYKSSDKYSQKQLLTALLEFTKDLNCDFVIFSGDLVDKGNEKYTDAYDFFLNPILSSMGLSNSELMICGGNHDLNRKNELTAIKDRLAKFKNNETVDNFVNKESEEFKLSLANINKFIEFQKSITPEGDIFKELYSIHKREINGQKVSVSTVNSAWRCKDSRTDSKQIFYPLSFINNIINKVSDSEIKLLIMHHPISDLADFNAYEFEDLVFQNFDILLTGHVHKKRLSTNYTSNNGILCLTSPSGINTGNETYNPGFSVINVDTEVFNVDISNYAYTKNSNSFIFLNSQDIEIPQDETKTKQNRLRKKLRGKFLSELESANDLLIKTQATKEKNFLDLYNEAILKTTSIDDVTKRSSASNKVDFKILLENEKSFLILGKDKSGKTTLLKKIQLQLLGVFAEKNVLPFYINFDDYSTTQTIDVVQLIQRYLELNSARTMEIIQNGTIKLLLDNFDVTKIGLISSLETFYKRYSNVTTIATGDSSIARKYENISLSQEPHSLIFLHSITRREIRQLADRWNLSPEEQEEILIKIVSIFKQLNIPFNYWTVSLFLWVKSHNANLTLNNNIDLINYYIDGLLEREALVLQNRISYDGFKSFIGELAYFLLKDHLNESYRATFAEIINFVVDYRDRNQRFVMQPEEIFSMLSSKGILKLHENDKYSFRLKAVFEYFIAFYMHENSEVQEALINDDRLYLSFSNEIELSAGFNRKNKDLLTQVFKKTKSIFQKTTDNYESQGKIDLVLKSKLIESEKFISSINNLEDKVSPLTPNVQDELLTELSPIDIQNTEVERKRLYDSIDSNPENLEKSLFILARVFRNTNIEDKALNNEIFSFILGSSINLGFSLIDEIGDILEDTSQAKPSQIERTIYEIISNFMPIVVQTFLQESISQNNLERLFTERLNDLLADDKTSEFKLLLIYFLVIELDIERNIDLIEELLNRLSIVSLKQTILLKLHYYMIFKSFDKDALQSKLVSLISKVKTKIDPTLDRAELNKNISMLKRAALVEKQLQK